MKGFAIQITWRDGARQWLQDPVPHTTIAYFASHEAAAARRLELSHRPGAHLVRRFDVLPYPIHHAVSCEHE